MSGNVKIDNFEEKEKYEKYKLELKENSEFLNKLKKRNKKLTDEEKKSKLDKMLEEL